MQSLRLLIPVLLLFAGPALADARWVRAFNLTEVDAHRYDASDDPARKTEAQIIVDRLYALGVRQINLAPRATMNHPKRN